MRLYIISVILIYIAILIGCCAASSSGSTSIDANIGGNFEIQAPQDIVFPLATNQVVTAAGDLTVTSNGEWNVQVYSDRPDGKMREYNSDTHQYNEDANAPRVDNPMHVSYGGHDVELSDTPQDLIVGSTEIGTTQHSIQFSTNVYDANPSMNVDVHVNAPNIYRLEVIFKGTLLY